MVINGEEFLCVISEIVGVGNIQADKSTHGVYMIQDVKLVPIKHPDRILPGKQSEKTSKSSTKTLVERLVKYLKGGFYFAKGYDLTASRQRRINFEAKTKKEDCSNVEWLACDSRYFWNKNNYQGFQENKVDIKWYTPVICGYVGSCKETFGD